MELALARNRHTPAVVLARSLGTNCHLKAMQLGAVDDLEKPLAPAEFELLGKAHCWPRQWALSALTA